MKNKLLLLITFAVMIFCSSCDATIGKLGAMGKKATISCYSGGKLVLKMKSSGKILSEPGSGYYFLNEHDKMVEVDMPCVIIYTDEKVHENNFIE